MARLVLVPRADIERWYPKAREFLLRMVADSDGRLNEETLKASIVTGEFWLCLVVDGRVVKAAVVSCPVHWATGLREMEIIGLTGTDMESWLDLEPELTRRFHALGYPLINARARPGWARKMKSRGYKLTHVSLEHRDGA